MNWISWTFLAVPAVAAAYLAFFMFLILRDMWRDR